MAAKQKTPEEIQAMRDEVAQYDAKQAEERANAIREASVALIDLVDGDTLQKVEDALPGLRQLALDQGDALPYLNVYCDALKNGIVGLRQLRGGIPALAPDPSTAAAPAAEG